MALHAPEITVTFHNSLSGQPQNLHICSVTNIIKNSSDGYTTEQVENCLKDEHSGSPKILGRASLTSTILFLVAGQFSVVKTPPSFQY